ncbi:S phase cyclin A-associated protein in the endoplasmic reticulum-like [Tubulanus polymorphus]|uniref:S phase cyclin A-associated protein in the endoplasmic reticulum-like n=1 Tax=Tubulanus polymorphus TaxID=672921 RepID=UPI003DA48103
MSDFRSKKRIGSGQKSRTNSRENLHKLQKSPSSSTSSLSSITGGTNNSRNRNGTKSSRQTNDDVVRSIVKEEGRTARNLIAYSVPLQEESDKVGKTMKLSASPRKSSQPNLRTRSADPSTRFGRQRKRSGRDETPPSKKNESASRRSSGSGIGKKPDLRARYWAFLFDNLQRAVDEIYKTCEADESELECREVIMMLERCTHDFKTLIQRFRVIKEFENADDGKRPTSLAWELRKTSPGKSLVAANASQSSLIDKQPSSAAQRALKFASFEERPTDDIPAVPVQRSPNVVSGGNSWADRVKGISTTPPLKKQPNSGDTENVPAINDGNYSLRFH